METGGDHPAAKRSWMLALLRLQRGMRYGGKPVLIGASMLILNPKQGDTPFNIELRDIDVRDMYLEPNVIGTPPKGKTIAILPARFRSSPRRRSAWRSRPPPPGTTR